MSAGYGTFLRITLPLAALNLLNQASRTVMSIVGPVLAAEFSLSASELGLLAACMFAAYGAAQLPFGVALDLLGPRRVQSSLALVAAGGFALFAASSGFAGFALARIVLGIGVAAGLAAVIKANSQWFAPAQVAGVTGLAMVVASLGSVLTTVPVDAALPALGWRGVFWVMAGASLAVAAWIFFSVRERPTHRRLALGEELRVTWGICTSRRFWRLAPAIALLSSLNFAYLGLWAGPWLRDVALYDGALRARTLLCYTLGMMVGGLAIGQITSRAHVKGYPPMLVPSACIAGLLVAELVLVLQPTGIVRVTAAWMLFAICTAGAPAAYVAVGQMFPAEQMGRVSTAINALTLAGAFLLQAAIGAILDLWPRTAAGGWDPRGYSAALWLSIAMHLLLVLGMGLRRQAASR